MKGRMGSSDQKVEYCSTFKEGRVTLSRKVLDSPMSESTMSFRKRGAVTIRLLVPGANLLSRGPHSKRTWSSSREQAASKKLRHEWAASFADLPRLKHKFALDVKSGSASFLPTKSKSPLNVSFRNLADRDRSILKCSGNLQYTNSEFSTGIFVISKFRSG